MRFRRRSRKPKAGATTRLVTMTKVLNSRGAYSPNRLRLPHHSCCVCEQRRVCVGCPMWPTKPFLTRSPAPFQHDLVHAGLLKTVRGAKGRPLHSRRSRDNHGARCSTRASRGPANMSPCSADPESIANVAAVADITALKLMPIGFMQDLISIDYTPLKKAVFRRGSMIVSWALRRRPLRGAQRCRHRGIPGVGARGRGRRSIATFPWHNTRDAYAI